MANDPQKPYVPLASRTRTSLLQADQAFQIALSLPAAVFIGWLGGSALDLWLHTHWIYMAGIMLGIAAGFVQIVRMLNQLDHMPGSQPKTTPKDPNSPGDQRGNQP